MVVVSTSISNTRIDLGQKRQGNKWAGMGSNRTEGITWFIWIMRNSVKVTTKHGLPQPENWKKNYSKDSNTQITLHGGVFQSQYSANQNVICLKADWWFPAARTSHRLCYQWSTWMFGNRCSVFPRLGSSLQEGFRAALLFPSWPWVSSSTLQLFC